MIAILADDLTSALDGAAPFTTKGLSARVLLKIPNTLLCNSDILAFDLNSRFLSKDEAQMRFNQAGMFVINASLIYKTIDSTLRGNLGAETAGVLIGSKRKKAIVMPAFPDAGRTTVNGHQYVNNIPLEQTDFANDPKTPVFTGDVKRRMEGLNRNQMRIYDAVTNEDINKVIKEIGHDPSIIWVGSPGIATALSEIFFENKKISPKKFEPAKKVLIVIGSLHESSTQQMKQLALEKIPVVEMVNESNISKVEERVKTLFLQNDIVCLISDRICINIPPNDLSPAQMLAKIVSGCDDSFDGLIVTGGDTARHVVDALNATSIDLIGEVEPGIPFGILNLQDRVLPFSTKAGGFGNEKTLSHCASVLMLN